MITSSIRHYLSFSSLAGACLLAIGSSTVRAAPAEDSVAPGGSIARGEDPAVTVPLGIDLAPFVGTSSALPRARRVVSLNLVGGLAGGLDVFELGGAFNLHSGEVRGLQLAGALNVVDGPVRGAQLAGALNVASDEVAGLQLSAVNVAGGDVEGAQIGAVNIAGGEVDGLQLGVVNVASRAKAGLGLVNVYWDGWAESDVAVSETTLALAGVRHGSEGLYNVYYLGTRLDRGGDLALGIGIGGRWLLSSQLELSLDVTTITTAIDGRFTGLHQQVALRPQIAWRIADTFALWAGPTLNVLTTDYEEKDLDLPSSAVRVTSSKEDVQVYLWPGFQAGVRVF